MTALDEIAWLLNLRGSDISYNPVFVSYVLLTLDKATLYVEESKVGHNFLLSKDRCGVYILADSFQGVTLKLRIDKNLL